jgi:hypothetical protein
MDAPGNRFRGFFIKKLTLAFTSCNFVNKDIKNLVFIYTLI